MIQRTSCYASYAQPRCCLCMVTHFESPTSTVLELESDPTRVKPRRLRVFSTFWGCSSLSRTHRVSRALPPCQTWDRSLFRLVDLLRGSYDNPITAPPLGPSSAPPLSPSPRPHPRRCLNPSKLGVNLTRGDSWGGPPRPRPADRLSRRRTSRPSWASSRRRRARPPSPRRGS